MSEISWKDFVRTSMFPNWVWAINAVIFVFFIARLGVAHEWRELALVILCFIAFAALYVADLLITVQRELIALYRGYIRQLGGDA